MTSTFLADLSIFNRYFNEFCSSEIFPVVPQLAKLVRVTHEAQAAHQIAVELRSSRADLYDRAIAPTVFRLWNFQPPHIFPDISCL